MDETNLEDKLNELVQEFGDAVDPQHKKLASLAREAQANQKKLERSINSLQESLDYLRVCIKYQLFDMADQSVLVAGILHYMRYGPLEVPDETEEKNGKGAKP